MNTPKLQLNRNKFSLYLHWELACFFYLFFTFSFFHVFVRMALTFKAPRSPFLHLFRHRLSNLQNESASFFSFGGESIGDGDFTVGGGVSMTGFNGVGVTVLGPCKMAP